jgi:hypothetical protein
MGIHECRNLKYSTIKICTSAYYIITISEHFHTRFFLFLYKSFSSPESISHHTNWQLFLLVYYTVHSSYNLVYGLYGLEIESR